VDIITVRVVVATEFCGEMGVFSRLAAIFDWENRKRPLFCKDIEEIRMSATGSEKTGRLSYADAVQLQRLGAEQVSRNRLEGRIRRVAGADAAFSRDGTKSIAVVTLLSYPEMELLEYAQALLPIEFPYIPGLLSFREAPVVLAAARKLKECPDVLLIDGQGVAHPRRFGLACHVGVELGWPTIGCAKSRLIGEYRQPGLKKGCHSRLLDGKEVIGTVLRSREGVRCLYVSVGHRVELRQAEQIVLRCCKGYRLPEPTRQAHQLVSKLRYSAGTLWS